MEKKNRADIFADECFEKQKAAKKRARLSDISMIIIFSCAVCVFAACVWALPQKDFSENENRYLMTAKKIDFARDIKNGSLTKKLADMYSDQFVLREDLIELKAFFELLLGRRENGKTMLGTAGELIPRLEYGEKQKNIIFENVSAISDFKSELESAGAQVTFAVAPRSLDVFCDRVPFLYSPERASSAWQALFGIEFENLLCAIAPHKDEYVWFKTDHHWTQRGAYYAYCALSGKLSFSPVSLYELEFSLIDDSFYGTAWSKSGMYWVAPDKIEAACFESEEEFFVLDGESEELCLSGLYDKTKLEAKDKYAVFLGGDYGHIKIRGREKKPRLLVIKDSYFNSLAPFLCRHFELDVIDLRYYQSSVAKYAEETGAKRVLILCGLDSLAAAKTFTALRY